jgi:hypothetical protein
VTDKSQEKPTERPSVRQLRAEERKKYLTMTELEAKALSIAEWYTWWRFDWERYATAWVADQQATQSIRSMNKTYTTPQD